MESLERTNFTKLGEPKRGKVRDVYDLGDKLLIVTTDRISAFDVVLPSLIPGKGKGLNQMSLFWFRNTGGVIRNHVLEWETQYYPPILKEYATTLQGRSILVRKTKPYPVECIVRGYITGSSWEAYKAGKSTLPPGLMESQKLDEPIFTPTTKAEEGHDIGITFDEMVSIVGQKKAELLRGKSLELYKMASEMAADRGIIIADTKFEFGEISGETILIDEILTPDSSRFWSGRDYQPGREQVSFDKQTVRDYLLKLGWDQKPPAPKLPNIVIQRTTDRYREIFRILTGSDIQ